MGPRGICHWQLKIFLGPRGILAEDLLGPPGNLPLAAASLSECQRAFMIGWPAVQCTQTRKSPACRPRDRDSRSRDRDSRSRPNRETGDFPIPDSGGVGNRGYPPRFPAKSGIGGTGVGDFRVWLYTCQWAGHRDWHSCYEKGRFCVGGSVGGRAQARREPAVCRRRSEEH